ncbi:hypothetical protein AMAG_06838 [Allomyces macrogynus ATCC 38327]|uniref:SHSP domain-containing protein n=1 Tax=Allomyces macrogynus (strain ATCC 38327) TaxID=578462 RepID=A0A0L0SF69_ALLM3|nr:hypothetical protein AMAG_06838 [Allomyces macrogynus ATCC 38327]|eukprot:KNE61084.1 hypothetical protein AMAG_06838 [Allomyces macrogynus ATCC 38327]
MSLIRPLLADFARTMRAFDDPFFQVMRRTPLANDVWSTAFPALGASMRRLPNVDISENESEYKVVAELPGLQRDQVNVEVVDNNTLVISGSRSSGTDQPSQQAASGDQAAATTDVATAPETGSAVQTQTAGGHEVVTRERFSEEFMRSIAFPSRIKADQIQAKLQNGLLELVIPKEAPVEPKPTKVNIQV